jgi:hypothetical protein
MATKGSKKLTDKLSGLFGHKETPQDQMRAQQVQQAHNKTREHDMISLLNCINIADPNNKLPLKTIQERGYDRIIRLAINELKLPPIFDQDIEKLDNHFKYAIHALDLAIKEGYETTAEWASAALHTFVTTLRTEVPGMDAEFADALLESKLAYAENLKILINASREFDELTRDIARQRKRLAAKKTEFAEMRAAMDAKRQTEEGVRAESEITEYANNPGAMSDAAKQMRDELYAIHRLKGEIVQLETDIETKHVTKQSREADVENARNRLATPPTVSDPMQQERINKANDLYINNMLKKLNAAEEHTKAMDQFISKISSLREHGVFIQRAVAAKNELDAMDLEHYQKQQRDRDVAARMIAKQQEREIQKLREQEMEHLLAVVREYIPTAQLRGC